jgi:pSer/pThr/pTyr-binding forkhead associated (FHA) protein
MDQRAKLIVREPGLDPVTVFLQRESTALGRGSESDARLHSPYVSRRHILISTNGAGHTLRPLDSANGTTLNGKEVGGEVHLSHGDEIRLADVSIWYLIEIPADAKTPSLPVRRLVTTSQAGLYLSLDDERHRVWIAERDQEVSLAPNEYKLLSYLFAKRGRIASREELLTAVWQEDAYDLESLYRLIQRVKEKIESDPSQPKYVISHRGLGYSLEIGGSYDGRTDRSLD